MYKFLYKNVRFFIHKCLKFYTRMSKKYIQIFIHKCTFFYTEMYKFLVKMLDKLGKLPVRIFQIKYQGGNYDFTRGL